MAMPHVRARDAAPVRAPAGRVGRFRWTICGLLFLAATINYVDRQVIGILKPTLQTQFGWSEIDYGDIVFAFQIGFDGSLVCGLAHLILADHDGPFDRRDAAGLAFGVLGLLCSGVAVTMTIVVSVFSQRSSSSRLKRSRVSASSALNGSSSRSSSGDRASARAIAAR